MTKTASRPGMRERCRCSRYTARGHASIGFLTIARRNGSSHNGLAGGSILAGIMGLGCMLKSKAEDGILPDLRGVRAQGFGGTELRLAITQARAHDGRRCDRDERTGQGLGIHGASARRLNAMSLPRRRFLRLAAGLRDIR